MQQIVEEKSHRSLIGSTHFSYKRILWSQTGFLQEQPDDFVYETLPDKGKPTITKIYEHLTFLMSIMNDLTQGDVVEYLRDVQACYEYLQEGLTATLGVPDIRSAAVWLNLNTTHIELISHGDLKSSLTSADCLCLNSPVDPLPTKVARNFLVLYEKLLKGLGCKTVMRLSSKAPPRSSTSRERSLLMAMAELRDMRDKNDLVDVHFEAQGERKSAHKNILAAFSGYCKTQFAGPWGRILKHQATIHLGNIRFLTLSQMIDFAYTGEFIGPELIDPNDYEEISETLGMLLDLLDGTDRWLLSRLHDLVDEFLTTQPHSAICVRVDIVEWVKERAETARVTRLLEHCKAFFESNEEFVVALREG